jgi:hypothetical protein
MESSEERVIGKPGMHAIDRADNVFPIGRDRTRIIHLVNTNRCGSFTNDPGDLAVCKKIPLSPGTHPKLPHTHTRLLKGKKIPGKVLSVFYLFDDGTGKCRCIPGINIF